MVDQIARIFRPNFRLITLAFPRDPWSWGAVAIALLVLLPVVAVLGLALFPRDNIWPHLWATTLPRYLGNSLFLAVAVASLSAAVGTGAAWFVTFYRFPLSRGLEWALLLPLAVPAYVGAYALTDFLEYAGPVQIALREAFGWTSARDYWFPEIRSRWAAVVVLSAALFPYVYLLTRAALREQSGCVYEVAQALGAGPVARFWRVGLPLARPAIAAGSAIVMMETISDFGVVEFFAVQTLTTGIFSVWLESYNPGGAAQIATMILAFILVLVLLEKVSRRRLRTHRLSRSDRPVERVTLTGLPALGATALCVLPFLVGFVLPVGVMLAQALSHAGIWGQGALWRALFNTISVGGIAAALTVVAAVFLVYGVRLSGRALPRLLMPVTTIGYAAPGAVLGLGILIPMSVMDHALADTVEALTGIDIGLVMTGSAFAIVVAYLIRFFAIAQGAVDGALGRVAPSLPMAARSLGRDARGALVSIYLPLIRGSLGTALLLVFVDSVKELPATLLLRPFNFETLATRTYNYASAENLPAAAPSALLVCLVGLGAVLILARTNR